MGARDEKGWGGIGRERLSAGARAAPAHPCLAEGIQDYKLSFPEARLAGSENPRQPASSRLHAQMQARRSWVPNYACKHAKGPRTQTAGQTACLLGPWLCCCGHHRGDGRTRSSLGGEGTSPTGPQGPCPQAQTLGSLVGRPRPIAPPYLGAEGAARQRQRGSGARWPTCPPRATLCPSSRFPQLRQPGARARIRKWFILSHGHALQAGATTTSELFRALAAASTTPPLPDLKPHPAFSPQSRLWLWL